MKQDMTDCREKQTEAMQQKIRKRLHKKDILTIPNALSVFRLLLIPVIAVLYCREQYISAVAVVVLSALTDIVDGRIARHFNMVSDLGKVLDPVADKLTQAAMFFCLRIHYPWVLALIILFAVKEITIFLVGLRVLKVTDTVNSAKWYGKLGTVLLYLVMGLLFLFPHIPHAAAYAMLGLCGAMMLLSMLLYLRFFISLIRQKRG